MGRKEEITANTIVMADAAATTIGETEGTTITTTIGGAESPGLTNH